MIRLTGNPLPCGYLTTACGELRSKVSAKAGLLWDQFIAAAINKGLFFVKRQIRKQLVLQDS